MEYATVVWNPSAKTSIRRIEAVLKRFTKRLHGLHNLSYNARLEALNEYSLESRRVRADLTFCTCDILALIAALIAAFESSVDVASIANRKRH